MATTNDYTTVVQQLYLAYFGRPADPIGLGNMEAALLAGAAPTTIADFNAAYAAGGVVKTLLDNFGNSPESSALYTGDDSQFITAIYNNVLGRAPLVNGLAFWTDALHNHDMTRAQAAVQIMAAAVKPGGSAADAATVAGRLAMASLFTSELVTLQDVSYYVGQQSAQEVRDLVRLYAGTGDATALRAVIDDFLATHHAPIPMGITVTLVHGPDTVTGGAGNDSVNAPSDATAGDTLEAGDSIDGAGGRDTLYLATQGALTTGATVKNVETVNLSSTHAITAADVSGWTGLGTLTIAGAGDVGGVLAASTTDVFVAAGQGALTLDGGHNVVARTVHGDITIGAGQAASGTVNASNNAAGGAISVNAAGFATLVAQDGPIHITGTTGFVASAYTAVSLAERSAHLAAQASASAAVAAAQASGDAAALAAATGALNAANATVQADALAAASAAHVVVTATSNTALTTATLRGNYGSSGNAITDASAQHNTLANVTLDNAGATTITGQALGNVYATGMTDDVTIVNSKAGHATTLTLTGVAGGVYTDDGAASVNLVTLATPSALGGLHVAGASTITISGAAGVDLGNLSAAANAVIDASGSMGDNGATVTATQSYLGGSGADTVRTGLAAQTAAVNGGAGAADKLILTGSANGSGAAAALFSGFEVLQVENGVVAKVNDFSHSAFSAVLLGGDAEVDGLNAGQAAHVALLGGNQAIVLGVDSSAPAGQPAVVTLTNATAATTLLAPSLAGVGTLNLLDSKAMTITSLTGAPALDTINANGSGDLSITTGALALGPGTVIDAHLTTGAVTVDASASSANGVRVTGSSRGANHLTGNASHENFLTGGNGGDILQGGTAADVLVSGNGNNTITGGGGNDHIAAGDGDNTIDARGTGASNIAAGNGSNVITGGSGADLIEVGSGANRITGGGGADVLSFGHHATGVVDQLVYAALGGVADTGAAIAANGKLGGVDIVTGLHGGDTIDLGQAAGALALDLDGTYTHAVAGGTASVELVRGSYVASTGQFTAAAGGADAMLAWADGNPDHGTAAIVLVGYAGAPASTLSASGVMTLG
ncbi:DUF4214 domain-containing protein [Duganella sp. FT3S]|uniref:DUF4214 domain-containing protein n=1 Tax=Rugamonas fusca TaxID=2758568 RepID=A0A7W2I7Q6_9BURK|nr:DUF4214 domain-containing protein [Rugamonas fusca]MBA5606741.1 DUF4214 domain-containing protein [Rugamonas fusca]